MMELDRYRTIKGEAVAKLTRKGSRFIGIAYPVESLEEVRGRLTEAERRYHDATHRCYAYRLLAEGRIIERADDAGEPARSAGPPILRVIEGQGLLNVLVVVARYFGGTKLGIGGLIRAYGDAAKETLAQTEVIEQARTVRLRIRYPPESFGKVMHLLNRYGAEVEGVAYSERPILTATLPSSQSERVRRALEEVTSGRVEFLRGRE